MFHMCGVKLESVKLDPDSEKKRCPDKRLLVAFYYLLLLFFNLIIDIINGVNIQ